MKPQDLPELTEDYVFEQIKNGPTRFSDLVQSVSHKSPRRRQARELIDILAEKGCIKLVAINGIRYYVLANWKPGTREVQEAIDARSKRTKDGCLEWIGFFNQRGEPMVWSTNRQGKASPKSVRRWLWEANGKGRLSLGDKVAPACTNANCIDPEHMERRSKNANRKGKPLPLQHRLAIAKANKRKLTPEAVHDILTSEEPNIVLAERYKCSRQNISQVRRRCIHQDADLKAAGMFAGLMTTSSKKSLSHAPNYP